MRSRRLWYIMLCILVLTISIFIVPAIADVGNFSGGSDYGGGSSGGSSGGGSWGGASGGVYFGGGEGGLGGGLIVVILIVIIIGVIISNGLKTKGGSGGSGAMRAAPAASFSLTPIASLSQLDPNFSETAMSEKISNLYVQMQHAWQDKKFDSMRPHMTDGLWNQFNNQLNEMINADCTNYVERIAVLGVNIQGWTSDDTNDIIQAIVSTRIVDYTLNDKTGQLVSGSKTDEKFMTYQWTLVRSKGRLTPEAAGEGREGTASVHCPSCGAPVEINQSAKCPYCNTVISAKDYDWSISAIKGISQRTGN